MPPGVDATLSYPYLDFKFKNNRRFPIQIISSVANGVHKISIKGIKEADDYTIKVTSEMYNTTPFKTIRQYDASLPKNTEKVVVEGINRTYR